MFDWSLLIIASEKVRGSCFSNHPYVTDTSGAPGESGDQGASIASNFSPPTHARAAHFANDTASPSPLLGRGTESDTSQQVCWHLYFRVYCCNLWSLSLTLQHLTNPQLCTTVYVTVGACWVLLLISMMLMTGFWYAAATGMESLPSCKAEWLELVWNSWKS